MGMDNRAAYLHGRKQGFNSYSAGTKSYGSGRNAPNIGPVRNNLGYKIRDAKANSSMPEQSSNIDRNNRSSNMRNAMLRKMKDRIKGNITPRKPVAGVYSGKSGGM